MRKKKVNVKAPPHESGQPSYVLQDPIYMPTMVDPANYQNLKSDNQQKVMMEIRNEVKTALERRGAVDEKKLENEVLKQVRAKFKKA